MSVAETVEGLEVGPIELTEHVDGHVSGGVMEGGVEEDMVAPM